MMSITVCKSDWVSGTEFILTTFEVSVAVHHCPHAIVHKKLEIHISGLEIHTSAFTLLEVLLGLRMQLLLKSTQNLLRNNDRN